MLRLGCLEGLSLRLSLSAVRHVAKELAGCAFLCGLPGNSAGQLEKRLAPLIGRHDGEALTVTARFNALTPTQQQDLITFLMSL